MRSWETKLLLVASLCWLSSATAATSQIRAPSHWFKTPPVAVLVRVDRIEQKRLGLFNPRRLATAHFATIRVLHGNLNRPLPQKSWIVGSRSSENFDPELQVGSTVILFIESDPGLAACLRGEPPGQRPSYSEELAEVVWNTDPRDFSNILSNLTPVPDGQGKLCSKKRA